MKKALQLQQAGIESVGTGMANQAAGQVMQLAGPGIARAPEEKRRALVADLQAEVRKFQGEVAPILRASATKWAPSTLGTMLEEKFSEAELKVLIAWLESPVSRKYQEVTPEAQQALSQKIVAETRAQVEPKLKALEQAMIAKINRVDRRPRAGPRRRRSPPRSSAATGPSRRRAKRLRGSRSRRTFPPRRPASPPDRQGRPCPARAGRA